MRIITTTRFKRGKLPHWEVERGRYFVTVRLADSLPESVLLRLREITEALAKVESCSARFSALQRQYFGTLERYLDVGTGDCLLRDASAAKIILEELDALDDWQVAAPHYSVMPNHLHALLVPATGCEYSLHEIMKRLKGRSALRMRRSMGGVGPVWQREWFDRWMRNDHEWERTVDYIRNNPVKAGLVAKWQDHPWTP